MCARYVSLQCQIRNIINTADISQNKFLIRGFLATTQKTSIERIVLLDFIHRLVSQEQTKLRK
jgi:hypothetical protein